MSVPTHRPTTHSAIPLVVSAHPTTVVAHLRKPPRTKTSMQGTLDRRKSVLVVEDDQLISDVVTLHLRDEGYEVTHVRDGQVALNLLEHSSWDALILDLMLPGVDGLEVCRKARSLASYTPIIMISARSSEVHRILGLEVGADDYLAKPFSVLELAARVRALLRRVDALSKALPNDSPRITAGALTLDMVSREVSLRGQPLDLTPKEFDLLSFFAKHPGKVFSRLELLNQVWGYEHDGYQHTVNTHINRLRAKIEFDPAKPQCIVTIWGVGYKLTPA